MATESDKLRAVCSSRRRPWWTRLAERKEDFKQWLADHEHHHLRMSWAVPAVLCLMAAVALVPEPWRISRLPQLLGATVLGTVVIRTLFLYWFRHTCQRLCGGRYRDLAFLALLFLMTVFLARAYHLFSGALVADLPSLGYQHLGYGAPLMVAPILGSVFWGAQAGMLMALGGGLLAAFLWPDSGGVFAFFLVSGVVAAHYVERGKQRLALIKAGAVSALAGVPIMVAVAMLRGWVFTVDFPVALITGMLGGVISGVLALGLAPMIEMLFGYTTDIQLMELASLDHPALQELMLVAPGTYHHSLVVSSLVEAASKEIGAHCLLAKVAALYHDIGKVKKPAYFVENQMGGPNRHEKLAPSMSALILTSHVKEGVELARKYKLGAPIIDIIRQHHGTRIINYFYQKALAARAESGQPAPDPEAYRYPGPRPQTREAGLVMLADTVEAASRSLDNPTHARIQGQVQKQINTIFVEGQLDECELTLKDLHKIAKIFTKILTGIFHQRIEYPSDEKAKKKNEGADKQPARTSDRPEPATDEESTDIRRLGLS